MSVGMLLDMAADGYGDREALVHGDERVTYRNLNEIVHRGAHVLRAHGARSVAYLGVNGTSFPIALLSAARAGVPFTCLNYRLAPEQLRALLAELDAPFVVADPEFAAITEDWHHSAQWYAEETGSVGELPAPEGTEPAVVLFTSGTTSKPKGVLLTHDNLVSYVLQTVEFASADETDGALISVPPYHIAGVGTVLTNIYSGRRMIYLREFTAPAWLEAIRSEGVTHAMVVPTMLARIVEHLAGTPAGTPTLRHLAYGGSRMPRQVLAAALTAFPHTGFVNAYGLTETSSTIAVLGPDDHREALTSDEPRVRARLGSAGRMVEGVEAEIRAPDGQVLGADEVGELWVRGAQVSGRYMGLGSVLDAEGWFPTRDRGHFDTDGYLFIEGRSDDTIIRGGENIAPAEIEDVLLDHPSIVDVAVFGMPDEQWGDRIVAAVVTAVASGLTVDEVRAWTRARLRGSRTPDEVVFIDDLPRTATGKLLRGQLKRALVPAGDVPLQGEDSQ